MFVDTFIRRPILATVCSLVIVLAGALAIPTMPIAWYPEVAPPTVSVTAVYTGANAETVETAVTTPLEQAINGVEGMLYMSSSSTNSGVSTITVTFDVTRDPDIAAVDVQNRVNQALGRLPGGSAPARRHRPESQPELRVGRRRSTRKSGDVRPALHLELHRRLRQATRSSACPASPTCRCSASASTRCACGSIPRASRREGLTAGDVVDALREQNVNVAAGSVGDAPARAGQTYQISVRAAGRLREQASSRTSSSRRRADGTLVRLQRRRDVELGAESYASPLRFQGIDAVGFGVTRAANRQRARRSSAA